MCSELGVGSFCYVNVYSPRRDSSACTLVGSGLRLLILPSVIAGSRRPDMRAKEAEDADWTWTDWTLKS